MKAETQEKKALLPWGLGSVFGIGLAGVAGWILYSRRYIDHHAKVKGILDTEKGIFESPTVGKVQYYVQRSGEGQPLLVIHGVHPAAGIHDIRPIFAAFVSARPVFALDLPGFGGSEKTDRPYRPSMYQAAIIEFIQQVVGAPCDIVCLGLSCEFAALAAQEAPDWVRSIVMINPTGFQMAQPGFLADSPRQTSLRDALYALLAIPLWSLPIFDLIASRPRLNLYYQKKFEYRVPEELVSIAYASAHQPGAHFAPMVFVSGRLHTYNVRAKVYEHLSQPVCVLYDHDPTFRADMLPNFVHAHDNWCARRIRQSRGMPHFDKPGDTFFAMDAFWKGLKSKRG